MYQVVLSNEATELSGVGYSGKSPAIRLSVTGFPHGPYGTSRPLARGGYLILLSIVFKTTYVWTEDDCLVYGEHVGNQSALMILDYWVGH